MLKYLLLKDNSLSIILPTGPLTLQHDAINYPLIRLALEQGTTAEALEPLLHPDVSDGIYYCYLDQRLLFIHHIRADLSAHTYIPSMPHRPYLHTKAAVFQGAFASEADLIAHYPEYFI